MIINERIINEMKGKIDEGYCETRVNEIRSVEMRCDVSSPSMSVLVLGANSFTVSMWLNNT